MPSIIFYYRDGVSEGEFNNVRDIEGNAIEGKAVSMLTPIEESN